MKVYVNRRVKLVCNQYKIKPKSDALLAIKKRRRWFKMYSVKAEQLTNFKYHLIKYCISPCLISLIS